MIAKKNIAQYTRDTSKYKIPYITGSLSTSAYQANRTEGDTNNYINKEVI